MDLKRFLNKGFLCRKTNGIIALCVLLAVVLALFISGADTAFFKNALSQMCVDFRGPVTIFCYFCLIVLLFLIFSPYGSIRLGGKDAKKEYSTFSWLSCLFMAGCGIGIVFYCQEPILHLHSNPYVGHVAGDPETIAYSLTLFNWTINAWVQYGLLGLIVAYFFFNKGKDLKLSAVLPDSTPNWIKSGVDILMALGVIAGLTTSLGLGVSQIGKGFSFVFGVDVSPYLLMFLIGMVATWSVTSGLKKGVKWLSNISTVLVCTILIAVVCIGVFHLDIAGFLKYIAKGTGLLLYNYIPYNDFYNQASDAWAADYPIFFDLWFGAWAAFVAVFVAKISRGRTIREFILGVVGFPILFTIIWFGIFGRVGVEFKDIIFQSMSDDIPSALFIFLQQISGNVMYIIMSVAILVLICLFFITSSDSGSFVVSTLLSKGETGPKDKMFWALIQCVVAMALFACGGLALVQSVSVIMGIIVMGLIVVGTVFFLKYLMGGGDK